MEPLITVENITIFVFILLSVIAVSIAGQAIAKRGVREPVVLFLSAYLVLAGLWVLGDILLLRGALLVVNQSITEEFTKVWPLFGSLVLATLFLAVSAAFLPVKYVVRPWMIMGFCVAIIALLIVLRVIPVPRDAIHIGEFTVYRRRIIQGILLLGWLLVMGRTMQIILGSYRQANRPLHKNRVVFWALSALVILVGDLLTFPGFRQGSLLHLAGGCIAGYVLVSHNLADILQLGLRGFSYLMISLLAAVVYAIVFMTIQPFLMNSLEMEELTVSLILGGILVFLFNPLIILVLRRMDKIVLGLRYDPSGAVREYSQGISNIVHLDYLAKTALGLIGKTFRNERNFLFLVDDEKVAGQGYYTLRLVKASDENMEVKPIKLSAESPIATFFSKARLPLTQYDLDLLPQYKNVEAEERTWFSNLEVDVFMPVCTRTEWIGLFVLGPKSTQERYFDEDLVLLTTLADQTAVALENARLFANLMKVNQDLVQTQRALEDANQHLREVDELKSAFIGVITHELRTPLSNIAFSLQLLGMYGIEQLSPEQREQLDQLNVGVKQARSLVENLITFAIFLNKQAAITLEELDFAVLIQDTLRPLKEMACEKQVVLKVDVIGDLLPVFGDRKYLEIAVYQLVHNAVKFTSPNGKIWVTSWSTSSEIFFDVKDTGVGVPPDRLTTLWGGFTQAADPLRRGLEGLGLGLALVKNIVAAHGGQVWADSWEGKGSVFGFQIPLEPSIGLGDLAAAFQIRQDVPRPQEGYRIQ